MKNSLASLLVNSQGRFVGVTFEKKDGTIARRVVRMGVKKYLKSDPNGGQSQNKEYVTVFDVSRRGYRSVHPARIQSLRLDGMTVENRK